MGFRFDFILLPLITGYAGGLIRTGLRLREVWEFLKLIITFSM